MSILVVVAVVVVATAVVVVVVAAVAIVVVAANVGATVVLKSISNKHICLLLAEYSLASGMGLAKTYILV